MNATKKKTSVVTLRVWEYGAPSADFSMLAVPYDGYIPSEEEMVFEVVRDFGWTAPKQGENIVDAEFEVEAVSPKGETLRKVYVVVDSDHGFDGEDFVGEEGAEAFLRHPDIGFLTTYIRQPYRPWEDEE